MGKVNEAVALPSKSCAACGGTFAGDALFCPVDGTRLTPLAGEEPTRAADDLGAERDATDSYLGQEISGHIEIRQTVGVGAMGRVYRAFQRGIDRDVAVKILHRELSANAQLVSRFTREAKVASRLQHPNVVQVLLAGQLPDRALYMVMEYLDGLSLQSALAAAGGALPLPRALHIALQLCEAVGEAHAQGIVHRDLKPENVMLVRRGPDPDFVKVLDFGIARINWGEQSIATAAGLIFGTARYISPEGAQGLTVGPAGDVYAIGTMLFQMLSGRTPFDGDQAVGLLVQQIHDPAPQLRSIPRAAYVPQPIADVVMATLAKDPDKREPDARALGQAIFDAARLAGLSPEELSRPMHARPQSAMKLPPMERTKPLELTPDVAARLTPSAPAAAPNGSSGGKPTAATVKWEPPAEFQARLATNVSDSAPVAVAREPDGARKRAVDVTIDDLNVNALGPASSPALLATPVPTVVPTRPPPTVHETPVRTAYVTPVADAALAPAVRPASTPDHRPSIPMGPPAGAGQEPRSRAGLFFVVFFLLGASIAAAWAWKVGKIGGDGDEERFVARAEGAMFKNRFHEPPGENVKDITDEGLRRWPNDRKLLDIRMRAANELSSQAITQRSAGDVLEALRLAKLARDLDPNDASAKRLVDQFEAEIAAFNSSSAPPTAPLESARPASPTTKASTPKRPPQPQPSEKPPIQPPAPQPAATDYKALLDVSVATPQLGQTVALAARIAPSKGDFQGASFAITGPGVPGVRMPAQSPSPGVFTASYAFLEPGRFEIVFTTTESGGHPISAKRTVTVGGAAPTPAPPTPTPSPTGSVKWM